MWQNILSAVEKVNGAINDFVWGIPMIVMILGTGLLLTIRTRFLQVRKFGESLSTTIVPTIRSIGKSKKKPGDAKTISQFEAFSAAISGTIGTGNIIGVSSAILTGGPGAVFWMWVSAFVGMVTNYSENVLGLYFRKKDKHGNLSGGAMYYISEGIHQNWLAYLAAAFCLLAAIGMSGVQANKITGTITEVVGNSVSDDARKILSLVIGIVIAILLALIIIGGIKRIGRIASILVPFMSVLFIIMALILICMHINHIGSAFAMIFSNIFSFKAAFGGVGGYAFGKIIQKGLARGVFSNEAGLGSSVIAHSASETKEPVKQGLWGIFEVFLDTFVICTLTALVILTSYSASDLYVLDANGNVTGAMTDAAASLGAFANLGAFGRIAFAVIMPLFAFTTILAWSYYGEKSTEFIFRRTGERGQKIAATCFKVIYVLLIVVFSIIDGELVWAISDTANGLMALPNLICLICLSGLVAKITKNYFDRKAGKSVTPMLSAYPERNEELIRELHKNAGE